jgi:hypothetical protein
LTRFRASSWPSPSTSQPILLNISDGVDYDDLLKYLSRLVDKGGNPLDILDEEDILTTKVNVVQDEG